MSEGESVKREYKIGKREGNREGGERKGETETERIESGRKRRRMAEREIL